MLISKLDCSHRQECMALQAKLGGLGTRSKELLLQQGAAVSGASVALSGLSSRLDALVEQLVSSYNISEKDLEVNDMEECYIINIYSPACKYFSSLQFQSLLDF